ncbi:hypothetical protein SAMN04488595_103107 [Ralstonia sp. 25mfcol4.1]|uniref:hypothetical protein n=1 Tax=Burkholderiaceae TaxID=119060 RepID=UPI0008877185|nr:hypothetical protein [Ralstonia sp. 25mfcol4.1]SDO93198.1 hypothetical protein SAMN04488595_103107 [Ralstonia sp. 25mfcol4.1]
MTGVSELFGWFVFNVAIPLLAPFALLPFAKVPVFSRSRSQGIVRRAIQDGQLLWAAIPLNASACYGLACWIDQTGGSRPDAWFLLCLHVSMIVAGSVLVLLGTLDSYPRSRRNKARANLMLFLSVFLSCTTAVVYAYGQLAFTGNGP